MKHPMHEIKVRILDDQHPNKASPQIPQPILEWVCVQASDSDIINAAHRAKTTADRTDNSKSFWIDFHRGGDRRNPRLGKRFPRSE